MSRKTSRLCGALSQGKLVQLYTQAIKTCQGKLGRLCGALSQGKLVQLYTRAISLSRKLAGEKLVHRIHEQWKQPRNLSRKTWSCVQGLRTSRLKFDFSLTNEVCVLDHWKHTIEYKKSIHATYYIVFYCSITLTFSNN